MTKPRYPQGCPARSKVRGQASSPAANSPSDYAWNVNFNNGNSNWNNHDNNGFVRAVRASECQSVSLRSLHAAWREARRAKKPSQNQFAFDTRWLDGLLELKGELERGTWSPGKPTCFIAHLPKAREIHAPDFADRVVHHWLVPQLEAIYEPTFIHDSYSNRRGKGTHAAVDRLQGFVREIESGEGDGWYLQLDVANFFNSIHRPTLYRLLKVRMEREGIPLPARRATHALLRHSPLHAGAIMACREEERARVPTHKRLENSAPGCGIAIGNLSSQFFANVYLDRLDQFVKHELRAKRYIRYVDDFVLVHRDREQLAAWLPAIERFLAEELCLALKREVKLRALSSGIDFLGYVIHRDHRLVRRRVVHHAREKLKAFARRYLRGRRIIAMPRQIRDVRSTWASYRAHFAHANSRKLIERFNREFLWIGDCANVYRRE